MFSLTELRGQTSLDKHGTIEVNTTYVTSRKPLWLVLVKLVVLAGMVGLGFAILMPLLAQRLSASGAALVTLGILLIYIGVSFFLRPNYNADNMGWFGGFGNDPFQYSDNINRSLFQLHMVLGPGRFAAETLLDLGALIGLVKGAEVVEDADSVTAVADPSSSAQSASLYSSSPSVYSQEAGAVTSQPNGLRSDRFDPSSGNSAWR